MHHPMFSSSFKFSSTLIQITLISYNSIPLAKTFFFGTVLVLILFLLFILFVY